MIERCFDFRRVKKFYGERTKVSMEVVYLMEIENQKDVGCWNFHPWFDGAMIHAEMGKECRGRKAINSVRGAFDWLFENTPADKIYGIIPNDKRHVQIIAVHAGMTFLRDDNTGTRLYLMTREIFHELQRKAA